MNRPIKFLAWDKKNKQMFTVGDISLAMGYLISIEDLQTGYDEEGRELDPSEAYSDHYRNLDDVILLQYTGLHAKNGREMYEGDLIVWIDPDKPWEIVWDQDLSRFMRQRNGQVAPHATVVRRQGRPPGTSEAGGPVA